MRQNTTKKALKQYVDQEIALGEDEIILPRAVRAERTSHLQNQGAGDAAHARLLDDVRHTVEQCRKCPLGHVRLRAVFGTGDPHAHLMFIGEGPGYEEDHQGVPFVGPAGRLLNAMIKAIGMSRESVYIANIVKCHPMIDPLHSDQRNNDRPPTAEEVNACLPYLDQQIELIKPLVLCSLGASATKALLKTTDGITQLRGQSFSYRGIVLIPTYHPSALLRNPSLKRQSWEDLKKVRDAACRT
jgi:DNA polymerase